MPLSKSEGLPENEPLVVGQVYEITGIVQSFKMKNGKGRGLIVSTNQGLRRTTSEIVIGQLEDTAAGKNGGSFPAKVEVAKSTSEKTGNPYIFLKPVA